MPAPPESDAPGESGAAELPSGAVPDSYADIVVNIDAPGIKQPLTYLAPPDMADLEPGVCVVVPFGGREAIGYVVARPDSPPADVPIAAIRPVAARVGGEGASLPPAVLQTARWMARTYLCDLATAVRCVIPDAQAAHVVKRVRLVDGWEAALTEITTLSHRQVILALSGLPSGAATEDELSAAVGGARIVSPLQILRKRGVIEEFWSIEPPRTAARRVNAVRLSVTWDDAETEAARREARAPGQARLLRELAQAGGGPVPVAMLLGQAQATPQAVKRLAADGFVSVEVLEVRRRPFKFVAGAAVPPVPTGEQQAAVVEISQRLESRRHHVALLYGVTASGKTEVYLRAIAAARRQKRTALVLVPEIALTSQVVDVFRARIGDRVAVLHSALSDGERRDEWQRIGRGEADVVVGARSAIFAPLANVGLIIVDEEHEASYKQDSPAPRYHSRAVAIARARETGATVVLGSATPSVESFFRAESGEWALLPLRQRALARPLPPVEVIDLREGYKKGQPTGIFSPLLREAIADRLAKGEQTILFLNRRGFAIFLLCRDCGYTTRCPHCDVSLTFHQKTRRLICHHCGYERHAPDVCPTCGGDRIRPFGIGTEKVEEETRALFPEARVLRMDRDTTARKDAHMTMLRTFRNGDADILIGTQMVAKGLDFAGVTLVGVVSADTALNMPDFRAAERAFQLLTQVSGRAGRGRKPGQVFVQTFNPDHESVVAAKDHDYEAFYRKEIKNRRELSYPPFTVLANIVAQDEDGQAAEARLRTIASRLGMAGETRSLLDGPRIGGDDAMEILGPAPCPLSRLKGRYRWHLLLKADSAETLQARLRAALAGLTASERFGVTVDVDPMSLM
jgi:primosomal protein N' (replication factor Y)